jgi:hypothetical protein
MDTLILTGPGYCTINQRGARKEIRTSWVFKALKKGLLETNIKSVLEQLVFSFQIPCHG